MFLNNIFRNILSHPTIIKFSRWEFLPDFLTKIPVYLFWLYFGIRAKNLFFFNVVNKNIQNGGMLNESKIFINEEIKSIYKPITVYTEIGEPIEDVLMKMQVEKLKFPVIIKPEIGGRGRLVSMLKDDIELKNYLNLHRERFLIQENITLPTELSVLYYRFPDVTKGNISSLCLKEPLSITGDGIHSILELLKQNPRAILQLKRLEKNWKESWNKIPEQHKHIVIEPIGNHCRGTKFVNINHLIDKDLISAFDELNGQTPGMLFVRYDLKCGSIEELKKLDNFKILEINGVGAEPAHIYDPNNAVIQNYKDLFQHWKTIYNIAMSQNKKGFQFMTWKEVLQMLRKYK